MGLPALLLAALATAAAASAPPRDDPPAWRDRRPKSPVGVWDALERGPAPALGGLTTWVNSEPLGWEDLAGNVVALVMWDLTDRGCRETLAHLAELVETHREQGLVVLAVHSKQKLRLVEDYVQKHQLPFVVAGDPDGRFEATVGVRDWPTVHVLGRDGRVRVAGVSAKTDKQDRPVLDKVLRAVLAEPYEGERKRVSLEIRPWSKGMIVAEGGRADRSRRGRVEPKLGPDGWPVAVEKRLNSRRDWRGKKGPERIEVQAWVTHPPELEGKVVLIAFWATDVGQCLPLMKRLQRLHEKWGDRLAIVAVSGQAPDRGTPKHPFADAVERYVEAQELTFPIAYDGQDRLWKAFTVLGMPHVVVMSSDGIVRWHGFPDDPKDPLTRPLLKAILERDAQRRAEEAKREAEKQKEKEKGGDGDGDGDRDR